MLHMTRISSMGFKREMTRSTILGFTVVLTRIVLMGFIVHVTRRQHMGFTCFMTRSTILGFTVVLTRMVWMGFNLLVTHIPSIQSSAPRLRDVLTRYYLSDSVVSLENLGVTRLFFSHSAPATMAVAIAIGTILNKIFFKAPE